MTSSNSYFGVTVGEEQQFRVALSNGGMTGELVKRVGNKASLGKIMVDALKAHLEGEALRKNKTFENEEVDSSYGYPSVWSLKPLSEQVVILLQHFPGLDVSHVEELAVGYLPQGMDGFVVIPKPSVIAKLLKSNEEWPTHNRAMKHLLAVMKTARKDFHDYTEGHVSPEYQKLTQKTHDVYDKLEQLPGDVIMLAVQTGLLHKGKSVRRARVTFEKQEFGLDSFAVGIIILTHPERLQSSDILWIDCAGNERVTDAYGVFDCAPCWGWFDGELELSSYFLDRARPLFGSASAVLFLE